MWSLRWSAAETNQDHRVKVCIVIKGCAEEDGVIVWGDANSDRWQLQF